MSEEGRKLRFARGPQEVLQALAGGDVTPEEALEFQRESFRAQLGCYPEELVEVCPACVGNGTVELPYGDGCAHEWHDGEESESG